MTVSMKIALLWFAFGATHMLMSSIRFRPMLVEQLGQNRFMGIYSIVSFACFIPLCWVYFGNRHMDGLVWNLYGIGWVKHLAMLLGTASLTLTVAALFQPSPAGIGAKTNRAYGLTRITRHPLFLPLAFWGFAHLLVNSFKTDVVFFGGFLVFGVLGCLHQDVRKRKTEKHLEAFFAETSFIPFFAILSGKTKLVVSELPWMGLIVGLVVSVGTYLLHGPLFR